MNRTHIYIALLVLSIPYAGCSSKSSTEVNTSKGPPDGTYPYLLGDVVFTKDAFIRNDTSWTIFRATFPVTSNTRYVNIDISKTDNPFSAYAHADTLISEGTTWIALQAVTLEGPPFGNYCPTITLYTGTDPTGDASKPLTTYFCPSRTSPTYSRLRYTQYHTVDTVTTTTPIPTVTIP
jgi:hypothetical protein